MRVDRSQDGTTFADVARQPGGSLDNALVQAGGEDVIYRRALDELHDDIDPVAGPARQRAVTVALMPAGNVGNAPSFRADVVDDPQRTQAGLP